MEVIENVIEHLKARNFTGKQIDMAIEALEKQIAKKPKIMNKPLGGEKFWWYCGHCGASRHTGSKANYCGYCGGKVDWD